MAAGGDDTQEKTEEPTQKRLDDARQKGQIARSKELNTFAIVFSGVLSLIVFGPYIGSELFALLKQNFSIQSEHLFSDQIVLHRFKSALVSFIYILLPIMSILLLVSLFAPMLLGGMTLSSEALVPKLDRMDPVKGLKRMISWKSLVELLKGLAKFFLIMSITLTLYAVLKDDFAVAAAEPHPRGIHHVLYMLGWCVLSLTAALALVAAIDIPFQIWDYRRQLKMSFQEMKDEHKEMEGKPEVKSKQRQKQMEISRGRMMQEVPEADVVITNPTHYAVALKYDQKKNSAPYLVAKGVDLIAANIRQIALSHDVPIVQSPALSRSIYYNTKIEEEIPEGLYMAVAQVLAYIYQLKRYRTVGGQPPSMPKNPDIPDELQHD